jgi:hypothetical protein
MRYPTHKNKHAPTVEDEYKREVLRHEPIFKQIIGCKIIKVTIPKGDCGHAEDAYNIHVIDAHHNTKIIKIGSSEWIWMEVVEEGRK